ncbi:FUSC family protein [Mangrovibrevibacter kandeliae]|uniref:FUSC family protein n=1 Tax=Mangrovibrevibacter kandeliae TaxID=2968473 RepID=UPI0021195181|nr:FUSC family protein [Aurantimonas sp. CSK15Z-1]MCQ8780841.1 FUSC family protein [Aurantimonas sp. CSK15Z-1]
MTSSLSIPADHGSSPFARLRSWIAGDDPGLTRLRMATRVTLTLLITTGLLILVHALMPLPATAYGIALITGMQGALVVREARIRDRLVTRLYAAGASFLSTLCVAFTDTSPRLTDGLFLVMIFVAVYARRFGARWNAVGMFAFMCYFLGVYLRPSPGDLPGVALALLLSGIVAHLVRNHLLPEHRARDFHRTLIAVEHRIDLLVEATRALSDGDTSARARAVAAEIRLKEAVLGAEGLLPATALAVARDDDGGEGALATALFDVHLAAEAVLLAALAAPDAAARRDPRPPSAVALASERLQAARLDLRAATTRVDDEAFDAPPPTPTQGGGGMGTGWRDPSLRLAIQVTLASAIAMVAGQAVSETRWTWAILTAFLVFTNTQSRGDTLVRASARAAGTLIGIVAGIAVAVLLDGQTTVSLVLIVGLIFAAFYWLQLSYSVMTFCITVAVSLLYGLLGEFTAGLLVLRLEETVIGALAGIGIAFLVFPRRTGHVAHAAADAFLAALDDLLSAATAGSGAMDLLSLSRVVDQRYAALALAARPLGSNWQIVRRPGPVRRALLRFLACTYWARRLARTLGETQPGEESHTLPEPVVARINALRTQVAGLREQRRGIFVSAETAAPAPRAAGEVDALPQAPDAIEALDMLAALLARIAGVAPPVAAAVSGRSSDT